MRLAVLSLVWCGAVLAVNPQLGQVHTVYILPMAHGLDQFLANRLTREGVFQVVTDPKSADAVLTDKVGEGFEDKLKELYPEPKPMTVEKPKAAKADGAKDDETKPEPAKRELHEVEKPPVSTFARGKGTIFLVDRRTRVVIWSNFDDPRNTRPETLNKVAEKIVNHLKRDLKPAGTAAN